MIDAIKIDEIGAPALLKDLEKVNATFAHDGMNAPRLLQAMAQEGQKFYVEGRANPWLEFFIDRSGHARH